jgi:hypothetical protein
MFKEKFAKLIDVKSLVTLTLIFTLVYIIVSGRPVDEKIFLLFSNGTTMILTYFFTKENKKVE